MINVQSGDVSINSAPQKGSFLAATPWKQPNDGKYGRD